MCHTNGYVVYMALWPKVVVVGHNMARSGPSKLTFTLANKWNMLIILVLKLVSQLNSLVQEPMHMDFGQKTVL